jgi:predicted PurR-regulated permease PerM
VVNLFTNILYAVIVIPLITFFIMKDGSQMSDSLLRLVPNRYYEITLNLLGSIETYIGRYFGALLIRAIVVSVLSTVLLAVVGLKYAVIVGIFTGLANTIPYFGPLIGMIAGLIVGIAQTGDFSLVPGVIVAMAVTQVVDNVLQPLVFSRAARMHPLVILCAVLIGAELGGIIGMLLAIPILTVAWVSIRQASWSLKNYNVFRVA